MERQISVLVRAVDPVSQVGVAAQLRACPDMAVLEGDNFRSTAVAVVVGDQIDEELLQTVRSLKSRGCSRIVLVAGRVEDGGLLSAIETGVCGVLRRSEATSERLASSVKAAASGSGQLAPDLLGRLLEQMGRLYGTTLEPRGLALTGLTQREIGVLKLVAEGRRTSEIAATLSYSERTVKNVLHDVTNRLNLRNRSHAVAYALRQGLI